MSTVRASEAMEAHMSETVRYGDLLVTRFDMYHDLLRVGVSEGTPAMFRYMNRPALDGPPRWRIEQGTYVRISDGKRI